MKRDQFNRPVCLGWGPSRRCGTPVHPGYCRCYNCDRPYDGEQLRWCDEQRKKKEPPKDRGASGE